MTEIIRHVSPGIVLLLSEKQICGTWLLINGKSCVVVEMPPGISKLENPEPAKLVYNYLKTYEIQPISITITHHHWDHVDGIAAYSQKLEEFMPFDWICHESAIKLEPKLQKYFNIIFTEPIHEITLENEPLFLLHAPKHSKSDVLIIFRGAMITGDWWLEEGDPNPSNIPPETSIASIERVLEFLKLRSYWVHSLFSVHGNDFRYDQNVENVLKTTRDYHQAKLKNG